LLRLLRKQEGIALVMAVGTLAVLTIAGTTVMVYTSSNTRLAARSKVDETSFSLSEAALNNAMAVLANPSNNSLDPATLPSTEATASSATYETGTAKWWGTLDRSAAVWTISALGLYNNPAGNTAQVRRKLTAKVPVTPTTTQPLNNPSWNYIMSTQVTGGQCDMTLAGGNNTGNTLTVGARLYVFGNLCLGTSSGGRAKITGGPLMVLGKTTIIEDNSAIGASGAPINEAHIKNGCQYLSNPLHNPCQNNGVDNLWATVLDASPTVLTAPTANWAGWYKDAIPGPSQSCTSFSGTTPTFDNNTTRDNSVPGVVDLTPASSYQCRVGPGASSTLAGAMTASQTTLTVASATGFPTTAFRIRVDDELMTVTAGFGTTSWTVTRAVNGSSAAAHVINQTVQWDTPPSGEISWNAQTNKLTVSGTIFIDGSAKIANGALNTYNGQATLYLSGTFLMSSGTKLCAAVSGSDCDFAGWDPNKKLFTIVANGSGGQNPTGVSIWLKDASWQGALFGTSIVRLEGQTNFGGPAIGSEVELGYNVSTGSASGFNSISVVPAGMPGNPIVRAQPNPPQAFAG
jgi:hypothetical protein